MLPKKTPKQYYDAKVLNGSVEEQLKLKHVWIDGSPIHVSKINYNLYKEYIKEYRKQSAPAAQNCRYDISADLKVINKYIRRYEEYIEVYHPNLKKLSSSKNYPLRYTDISKQKEVKNTPLNSASNQDNNNNPPLEASPIAPTSSVSSSSSRSTVRKFLQFGQDEEQKQNDGPDPEGDIEK